MTQRITLDGSPWEELTKWSASLVHGVQKTLGPNEERTVTFHTDNWRTFDFRDSNDHNGWDASVVRVVVTTFTRPQSMGEHIAMLMRSDLGRPMKHSIEQQARILGVSVEAIRSQHRRNAVSLREMERKAKASKSGKFNGYSAKELAAMAEKSETV